MRMQESFKGDKESPNKRHMKKLGFFQSPFCITIPFLIGFTGFSI